MRKGQHQRPHYRQLRGKKIKAGKGLTLNKWKYTSTPNRRRSGVHVGSHIRGVKVTDPRSRRARSQDLHTRAKHILTPTKKNIQYWKKHRNQVDLIGVDVLLRRVKSIRAKYKHKKLLKTIPKHRRTQIKDKRRFYTLRVKTGLTGVEEHQLVSIVAKAVGRENIDKVDINSLVDRTLNYSENKRIIEAAVSPTMRDAAYLGYTN